MSSEIVKPRTNSSYTAEEIERGLVAVALASGNTRRAAAVLTAEGVPIPRTTLQRWVSDEYAPRYSQIHSQELPRIYERMAQQNEALAQRFAALEGKLADKVEETMEGMRPDQAASALRNVTVAKAVNIDKASLIRGRPTEIRETRDVNEILDQLNRKFPGLVVDAPFVEEEPTRPRPELED